MSCPAFTGGGPSLVADALAATDCRAGEATAAAFARLFGGEGVLTTALSLALTLYVALFAVRLLTGQSRLGITALTPRMMGLGLALTFATSWMAYSSVIWALLASGPDWIAGALLGIKGSASQAFAARLDLLFVAVADAAAEAQRAAPPAQHGTTPADLLSYAALLLLLGTVGVMVTSRIALAVLLALGPVFIILALFRGTRGLFEGWLRAAVMFALAPMFATLIGVGSVAMLGPVVDGLGGGEIGLEQAAAVFVAAATHCMLMAAAFKLVGALTSGWQISFAEPQRPDEREGWHRVPAPVVAAPAVAVSVHDRAVQPDGRMQAVAAAAGAGRAAAAPDPEPSRVVIRLPRAAGQVLPGAGHVPAAANDRAQAMRRGLDASAPHPPALPKEPIR